MTGSPVFKFNSHLTKKQKIQRKLNFVRDVPHNQLRLHIDNLLDSDINSDSQGVNEVVPPSKSFSSLSSFVFENKKGVKRKLDFDADDASDQVSSFKFSNKNISLNGFHSRNSSLGDIKSIVASPSKNRGRRSSYTRSSIASTCRRRLFPDAEPEMKKMKLESPVLCPQPKKREIKLSLKKRFPGVPNSEAARSGLLLNLAFSKYNMLNNNKEENVSVNFVDEKNGRSSSKKELLQYSSIKKDSSSFHFSPVFKAVKKVKRKLDLEENDAVTKLTTNIVGNSVNEASNSKQLNSLFDTVHSNVANVTEISTKIGSKTSDSIAMSKEIEKLQNGVETTSFLSVVEAQKSATKEKSDFFKNSSLRPSLRNEIFNLSNSGQENTLTKVDSSRRRQRLSHVSHSAHVLAQRNSLGCIRVKSKFDRIIVNKDLMDDRSSSRTDCESKSCSKNTESAASRSAKRWFDDSFYRGRRSDLRKSLFHRRQEVFLDSHIQRFLNDCAHAAESRIPDEPLDSPSKCDENEIIESSQNDAPASRIEDVESPVSAKVNKPVACIDETLMADAGMKTTATQKETSPVIQFKKRKSSSKSGSVKTKYYENVLVSPSKKQMTISGDFIIEDSTSQEISKHCVEEVELFIENAESDDGFIGFTNEDSHLANDTFDEPKNSSILDATANNNTHQISIEGESSSGCSHKSNLIDPDLLVEEVSSSESISEELHLTEPTEESSTPGKNTLESNNDETFDSAKKRKRKKYYSDNLVDRLERLICRENSDMRMWEYEMSKRTENKDDQSLRPAVFRVQKMWNEFSKLILQCTLTKQDPPDKLYEVDEMKHFGLNVTNSTILIMEPSTCPKTLTYSSIFRIHPPWNILSLEHYTCVVILRPTKVEIISKDDTSFAVNDFTFPNELKERQICSCQEACSCTLPEGYQTVIQPLLYSSSFLHNIKSFHWKAYDEEYFRCTKSINKVVLKHKLFPSQHLILNLRVLHVQRYFVCNEYVMWHYLCADEEGEICCIVIEDKMKIEIPVFDKNEFLRFFGIVPWKIIPANTVPAFIDHFKFPSVSEIENQPESRSLYVFVLSSQFGMVNRIA